MVRTRSTAARLAFFFTLALAAHPGCNSAKTGGETHWLGECDDDRDCGGGQCLCGVCSRVCGGDGDCGGSRRAQCYSVSSPGLAPRCVSRTPQGIGICLGVCSNDADCPSSEECLLGACVVKLGHDAGPAPEAASSVPEAAVPLPPTGQIATQYVHTDAGTRFGEPVLSPEPSPFIDGASDDLVGLWEQTGADGGPCNVPFTVACEPPPGSSSCQAVFEACMQLRIEKQAATGAIVGHVSISWPDATAPTPPGPFPKATDPDHGYPAGVDPRLYFAPRDGASTIVSLSSPSYPGVEYTVFDGHVDGKTLSFWIAGTELWQDWCALQTPYPFRFDGMNGYRCVPQDATPDNTDYGKFLLCTSVYDEGVCSRHADPLPPIPAPCLCQSDAGRSDPRCYRDKYSVCECTASRCQANLHTEPAAWQFTISGSTMHDGVSLVALRKVSP